MAHQIKMFSYLWFLNPFISNITKMFSKSISKSTSSLTYVYMTT